MSMDYEIEQAPKSSRSYILTMFLAFFFEFSISNSPYQQIMQTAKLIDGISNPLLRWHRKISFNVLNKPQQFAFDIYNYTPILLVCKRTYNTEDLFLFLNILQLIHCFVGILMELLAYKK